MAPETTPAGTDILVAQEGQIQALQGVSGDIATRLLQCNMDASSLRPWIDKDGHFYCNRRVPGTRDKYRPVRVQNATLRRDEWIEIDDAVLRAARNRLVGVADLTGAGLTYTVSNGLGKTVLEYQDQSDISDAEVTMDAETRVTRDRPEWDTKYLPLPVTHKDFQFSVRVLESSRSRGEPLDVSMAELAGRKVAEKVETMLFNGLSAYNFGGGTIRGYLDHPNRNTGSLTANWDDSASSGPTILADVLAMKQSSIDAKYFGPWGLYIPTNFETSLDDNFTTNYPISIRDRLMQVSGISSIKTADSMTADNVILVQMTTDVVRMVVGLSITTVQWESNGGLTQNFKVMAIMVPQIRADQDGNSGVTHYS